MLRRHPQIYLPALKEPQFFAPEMRARTRGWPVSCREPRAEYLALFADAKPATARR